MRFRFIPSRSLMIASLLMYLVALPACKSTPVRQTSVEVAKLVSSVADAVVIVQAKSHQLAMTTRLPEVIAQDERVQRAALKFADASDRTLAFVRAAKTSVDALRAAGPMLDEAKKVVDEAKTSAQVELSSAARRLQNAVDAVGGSNGSR